MPRKPTKKVWRSKCDKLAGLICKHNGRCLRCGSREILNWAHIKSRSYYPTRWDMDNCVCLCQRCHMYFTKRPSEWELWITSVIGKEKWWELTRRSIAYGSYYDYNEISERLQAIYDEIKDDPTYTHAKRFLNTSYEEIRREKGL